VVILVDGFKAIDGVRLVSFLLQKTLSVGYHDPLTDSINWAKGPIKYPSFIPSSRMIVLFHKNVIAGPFSGWIGKKSMKFEKSGSRNW